MPGLETQNYCPLCDRERTEPLCPVHHVPTLPPPTQEAAPPIANGSLIAGRYRVEGVLSHGGMGTVLDATQIGISRPVVVKVLRDSRAEDRGRVRRFYLEARLISALDHPNIVRIYEFGLDPTFRVPFIAMEKVEGVTMQRLVQSEGPLPERRCARLFLQITRALVEANHKGVLHRDLKPRNVMVRRLPEGGEHVTVLDFGLAKFVQDDQSGPPLTAPGRTVGTPGFMSPEQVLGRPLDFRSDLYGLGCMLYTALAGRPPFEGSAALSVMRKQVREPAPALPGRLGDGRSPSAELRELVEQTLAKDPDERPRTLEDVLKAFERMARERREWIEDATTRIAPVRSPSNQPPRAPEPEEDSVVTTRAQVGEDTDAMATVRLAPDPPAARPPAAKAPAAEESADALDDADTFRQAMGPKRTWIWAVVALAVAVAVGVGLFAR